MRKLILISALLLASASAYAGPNMTLAANDTPAATTTTTDTVQPLPPANQPDAATPAETPKPQAADTAKPHTSRPHVQARRHEGDEAKARRIAAKYGVYW